MAKSSTSRDRLIVWLALGCAGVFMIIVGVVAVYFVILMDPVRATLRGQGASAVICIDNQGRQISDAKLTITIDASKPPLVFTMTTIEPGITEIPVSSVNTTQPVVGNHLKTPAMATVNPLSNLPLSSTIEGKRWGAGFVWYVATFEPPPATPATR